MTPLLALVLSIIIVGTTILPIQVLNAQNVTANVQNASSSNQVSSSVISTLAKPGFGNKYDVALKGSTVPISYNIIHGAVT